MPRTKLGKHKGKYDLSNLDLDFISLVPAGDDGMAKVLLAKAEDKSTTGVKQTPTLSDSDISEGDDMTTMNKGHDEYDEYEDEDLIEKDDLPEEVVKYIEALEDEVDDLNETIEKARKGKKKKVQVANVDDEDIDIEDDGEDDDVSKSHDDFYDDEEFDAVLSKADPAVRGLIAKMQSDLTEAENIAKAERDERLRRDYIAKAEQLPMISTDKDQLGELLKALNDKAPEEAAIVEKLFGAANKQISESNLFGEIGKSGAHTTLGSSVEAAASEIRKANPGMTQEQAIAAAYESNPSLYEESLKEG